MFLAVFRSLFFDDRPTYGGVVFRISALSGEHDPDPEFRIELERLAVFLAAV